MSETDLLDAGTSDANAQPSRYPFLNRLNLDMDVTRRLSLHLDRTRVGDNAVITSALGKSHNPSAVLESWTKIFDSNLSSMNSVLVDLERANLAKYGPRSICKPFSERLDSLKEYYNNKEAKLPFDILSGLKTESYGRLRPLSIDAAMKCLKNSTNSGLPYYKLKGLIKNKLKQRLEFLLSRRDPCILFSRTQEGGKTRNVWGYPAADTLEEMRYYRPLLDYQSRLSWRSALLGPDEVSRRITALIELSQSDPDFVLISGDMAEFDARVVREITQACFFVIKMLFQDTYRSGLDRIMDRFMTIGLVTPLGITEGLHGVPSGSTFTNEVDSIIHYLIFRSLNIPESNFQVQGDDFVLVCKSSEVERLQNRYTESHMVMHPVEAKEEGGKTSAISRDYCFYLQNLYHSDYKKNGVIGGIYPTYRALGRIMFQERWQDFEDYDLGGVDYYSIRTISILENCKHHPLFRDFVEFVYGLDKYSLRFSKSAVSKYDAYLGNSSGDGGFMKNQYSDDVKGIYGFETMKIIRELNRR